ncbi:MAG TPA: ribosomal protein S19 family protein [archaeon]|nr:ribosomal protein S19 family protein [archaeon]
MPKEYKLRGKSVEEVKGMSIDEFSMLLPSRQRRHLKRGLTEQEKKLLDNIKKNPEKFHKTHVRSMIVLPQMIGVKIGVYIGGAKAEEGQAAKEGAKWTSLIITPDMLGHRLGEFSITTKHVRHNAPGLGATRGSKFYATKT